MTLLPPRPKGIGPPTIDDVKAYWDRRPCNVQHSPKKIGTREYFDEVERRKYFVELIFRVSPNLSVGVTGGYWRLAAVSAQMLSISRVLVLTTPDWSYR